MAVGPDEGAEVREAACYQLEHIGVHTIPAHAVRAAAAVKTVSAIGANCAIAIGRMAASPLPISSPPSRFD